MPHFWGMIRFCSFLVLVVSLSLPLARPAGADVVGAARVVDGDTIEVAGQTVRLFGIDAPERTQTCAGPDGAWPCGRWASRQVQALVAGGVACDDRGHDRYGRLLSVCTRLADGTDLNAALVAQGAAVAFRRYSDAYVAQERAALRAGQGVWVLGADAMVPPEQFRAARWMAADGAAAPADCAIKGNISASGHIYHLPGQHDYDRTRINENAGERWFCSEAEARAAGWRPAQR